MIPVKMVAETVEALSAAGQGRVMASVVHSYLGTSEARHSVAV